MSIGARITQAREAAGLKKAELARRLGIRPVNITQWEQGKTRPDVARVAEVAKELGVSVEWLLSDNNHLETAIFIPHDGPRFVPRAKDFPILGSAEAGNGWFTVDTGTPIDFVNRPIGLANRRDAYGIYVQGESMQPIYAPGDLVYVDPKRPPAAGRDCIIQMKQTEPAGDMRFMLKRLVRRLGAKWIFKQYNPEKEIELEDAQILAVHLILKNHELI